MNETVIAAVSVVLFGLAVIADVNVLRVFVSDWRAGRREQKKPPRLRGVRRALARQDWLKLTACAFLAQCAIDAARAQVASVASQPMMPRSEQTGAAVQAPFPAADAPQSEQADRSPFSLQFNLDYTSAYFYHGILQEDSGLILQPAAKATISVFEEDDFKVDAILGVWNSFHGQKTGAGSRGDFTDYWYEADLIAGFVVTKDKLSLTTTYTVLASPSDAYETVQELDLTLAYDDAELLGKLAVHPFVLLGVETGADASDGADSDAGTYLEFGIAPGTSFDIGLLPVSFTFPASIGLSLNNYYQDAAGEDDTFGFAQMGAKASFPLPFDDRYGRWTFNAGVSALFLGDHTSAFNGGDRAQLIGTIGVQLNF